MKVGSLIKCKAVTYGKDQFGVIIRLTYDPPGVRVSRNVIEKSVTWAEIQWHDGHRTWEDMGCSLEHNFEVIG